MIKQHIAELFPDLILDGVHAFRVTRNSDLYIDDEEAENLLRTIEQELRRSSKGDAVRLEVEADCPKDFIELLLEFYDLTEADVYKSGRSAFDDASQPAFDQRCVCQFERPAVSTGRDPALPPHADMFEVMRRQDILLHHPYDSFEPIVDLMEEAAHDPQVLAIKITLYRTSGDSPIVEALIDAANAGKQVTAIVELRARFDEAANIQWARRLEEAGAHVIYGVVGLKTHCKAIADRPARYRSAPTLRSSGDRQLSPADRAHLHRLQFAKQQSRSDRRSRNCLQHPDRSCRLSRSEKADGRAIRHETTLDR